MISSASAIFLACASRASRFFSAMRLPASTRLGFFVLATGICEVTC